MKIAEARHKIVEKLKEKGLLEKVDEKYAHNVRVCYKCETTIEPQILDQWFVKMDPLAKLALDAVASKKISFIPERYEKTFVYWMENTIDWNISRQIVWGIPIPAKICNTCAEGIPDLDGTVTTCPKCEGSDLRPDIDTFDTWFSSGQWPLMVTGYPDSPDFKKFYPTDVMETGYDLIFKWVPRMVIFGLYLAKDVPFHTVYLHGLVNDEHGKKMSKSKGNVMNPLEMSEKYGSDAVRMALVVGNPAGADSAMSENKIRGYRNFSTKIWNIARFVNQYSALSVRNPENDRKIETQDRHAEYLKEFESLKTEITKHLDDFEFHLAAEKTYHYVWHTLADKIIEEEKGFLKNGTPEEQAASYAILEELLLGSLRLLHPFMPFITEEIYQIFRPEKMLMVEKW